jgi:hypothetical protein
MRTKPYLREFATEAAAVMRMRIMNQASRDGSLYCLVPGTSGDNFAVVAIGGTKGGGSMTFGQRKTVGGYVCEEVTSAMQKCIRRGMEEQALFWATELDLTGFGEYVWKRLKIIASEDVGLEENSLRAVTVRALYDNWLEQRKKNDSKHAPERLFVVHAVLALSRSYKSRVVDNALIVFYEGKRNGFEIPDFALDRHTQRGRRLKRGWGHFFSEGVGPLMQPDATYEARAREIRRDNRLELEG